MKLGQFDTSEFPECLYKTFSPQLRDEEAEEESFWRYCVLGNIVAEHVDENGFLWHGTKSFPGYRKVYISKSFWPDKNRVVVIGLNRFKTKYTDEFLPLELIKNIRVSKTYNKRVLQIMSDYEYWESWFGNSADDRKNAQLYAEILNEYKKIYNM